MTVVRFQNRSRSAAFAAAKVNASTAPLAARRALCPDIEVGALPGGLLRWKHTRGIYANRAPLPLLPLRWL